MEEGIVGVEAVRLTDVDLRRLQALVNASRRGHSSSEGGIALLERHLDDAEVLPAVRIGPDVVTMDSEVRVRDLDTHEAIVFRIVFPRSADAAARRISVLAPLGMAVLGRRAGAGRMAAHGDSLGQRPRDSPGAGPAVRGAGQ